MVNMNKSNLLSTIVFFFSAALFFLIHQQADSLNSVLLLIGILMGITLFKGMFGFTGAYFQAINHSDMRGVFSQIMMLALATLLFAPMLALGYIYDHEVVGAIAPLSIALVIGAFLFGMGMQLGGSCASGTLFIGASGNRRTIIVLIFFCVGAFLGSLHLSYWQGLPSIAPISLADTYGFEVALPLQLTVLAILYALFSFLHKVPKDQQQGKSLWWRHGFSFHDFVFGTWPLMLTASLLAILNWLVLLVAGHPWSITWAFSLWGAKLAMLFGWVPDSSDFWSRDFQLAALNSPILQDETSVMNIGIFLGALLAASLAKKFKLSGTVNIKGVSSAIIAGLLMGYGARLAYGCNIGAFFSGIASTSLHGWLWIICAIPGFWFGIRIARIFNREERIS